MSTQAQTPAGEMETGEVCIANISPSQRMRRLRFGIISLVIGLAVLAALMAFDVSRWWRLALFPVMVGAATGYFQWHDKTCVALAARNTRHIGDHEESIEDGDELAQVKRQANRVQLKSFAVGLALTLVTLALPLAW